MSYNPEKEIAKLKIPVAIIQGKKDLQVDINDAKKLYNGNPKTHLYWIEDMNHVLKTISKNEDEKQEKLDNQNSYISPEYPISQELVKIVKNFVFTKEKEPKTIILGK